ncbi:MAG: hypothetical protein EPN20_07345 [Magnetospirillum sp.]|nr:MAG: hypothetical protein EPN20_07345 [Magnetospirillum sp.]
MSNDAPRVYVLSTIEAGADLIQALNGRVPLAGIIGLSERPPSDAISGYISMRPLAERLGVDFVVVDGYSLTGVEDRRRLEALDIDLLLVCGWQRLVPEWLIRHCRVGTVGTHGSSAGISGGRGRSPQNWALMLGAARFSISIFFIDAGIDSGPVIATRTFPYEPWDDIASSYVKATLLTAEMVAAAWADGSLAVNRAIAQNGDTFFLPQRKPEDGGIDWSRSATEVSRFIAALSRPYPGAFTVLDGGGRLIIWRARPLSLPGMASDQAAGTVVMVTAAGKLVVATGNGLVLVDEYEILGHAPPTLSVGKVMRSEDFHEQMRSIIGRHRLRFPDQPLSSDILDAQ